MTDGVVVERHHPPDRLALSWTTDIDEFIQTFVEHSLKFRRQWLVELLDKKLKGTPVEADEAYLGSLADQIMASGSDGTGILVGPATDKRIADITIEFTQEDLADLNRRFDRLRAQIPDLLKHMSNQEAQRLFVTLKEKWPSEYAEQLAEHSGFRDRLEDRWGEGLALLRLLLTTAREIGYQRAVADAKSRSRKDATLRRVLLRLHARACQITAEIMTLLENGFADGAMARWRTAHEVSVVATILMDGGEDLAQRYVDHQKVEAWRALKDYEVCHVPLGYNPISKAAARRIERAYDGAIKKYGPEFRGSYGWASAHLAKKSPTWGDLQTAANRAIMQSHFRMASHTVHAGPHGIYSKLGLLQGSLPILAGASNAGLAEPAQNTALTLMQITGHLFPKKPTFFDLIGLRAFVLMREAIPGAFATADRQLRKDEQALHGKGS